MKPVRFVLAVPLQRPRRCLRPIEDAPRPGEVCARSPRLWTEKGVPQIDCGSAGRILGVVFARSSANPCAGIPVNTPVDRGVDRTARWMIRECWGAYFAVFADQRTGDIHVLVDPSGLLPVYRAATDSHVLLASHPELLAEAANERLEIDWRAIRYHLKRPELRQRFTCLARVSELPPGSLVHAGAHERPGEPIWRPEDFLPQGAVSFDDAADELGALATRVIGAWARCLGPAAIAASGGVDSSFICAALARGGHSFDCLTLSTADPSGDETVFVRTLADHLGAPFHSRGYDLEQIDPWIPASAGLPRPSRKPFLKAVDAGLVEAGRAAGTSVVFDGNGGDNLFCFLHSAAPIVDHLLGKGSERAVLETLFDICRVTDCDVPTMIRAVLRRLLRPEPTGLWPADTRLLAKVPDYGDNVDPLSPWLDAFVGRQRGKHDHLALIMRAQHHIHGLGAGGLPRFSPLMSQPLLEFCLAVPTWLWCKGGINRALARAAFANDLPRSIMLRTSKAGPDSFIRQAFEANRPVVRELLMGGLLAEQGLLDLDATERALDVDALSGGSIIYRLLDLAEAESWARSWTG